MQVALIQHRNGPDRSTNLEATAADVAQATAAGADLIVLAELHTGPYFCQHETSASFAYAEPIPGPSSDALSRMAAQHRVVLVGSLFERRAAGLYHNTAVVFERDGQMVGRYRKMHIPDDPGYYEKYYFTPGDLGFTPIDTSVGRLGVLVCWDQWYPEAARLMALAGAEMLIYPTAIGWDPNDNDTEKARQREAWMVVQRGHAVANGLPVIACNRVGFEADPSGALPGAQFWGSSFVAGPQGELVALAADDQPEILMAPVPLQRIEPVRQAWPFLRDRRIDAYQGLLQRYLDPR